MKSNKIQLRDGVDGEKDFNRRSLCDTRVLQHFESSATLRIYICATWRKNFHQQHSMWFIGVRSRYQLTRLPYGTLEYWISCSFIGARDVSKTCVEDENTEFPFHRPSFDAADDYRGYGRDQLVRARNFYNVRHSRIALHILDTIELYYRELFVGGI